MATPYAGVNAWVDDVIVPDDGDERDGASIAEGEQALADRTKYLYERVINGDDAVDLGIVTADFLTVTGGDIGTTVPGLTVDELAVVGALTSLGAVTAGSFVYRTTQTLTRVINIGSGFHVGNAVTGHTWEKTAGSPQANWINKIAAGVLLIELDVPDDCVLKSMTVRYKGGIGHTDGNAPSPMPSIELIQIDEFGVEAGVAGTSASDTSFTTAANYQTSHNIAKTGLTIPLNRDTNRFLLKITAEGVTNYQLDALVQAVKLVYEVTTLKPA